jgi:predicted dehydrogenase
MGCRHTANFKRLGADIVALYDVCPEAAEHLNELLGLDARICHSLDEALDCAEAVVAAVSPEDISDVAVAAADAGRDLFCEKPPGLTVPDATRIVEAVERNHVICDFDFHYDVDAAANFVGKLIAAGHLGQVSVVHFSHHNEDNTGDWEHALRMQARLQVESPMLDSGIHRMRQLERWLGPGKVIAAGGSADRTDPTLPGPNIQFGWLLTQHPMGRIKTYLDITWFAPGPRCSPRAFGLSSPVQHPYWTIVGTDSTVWWLPRQQEVWVCSPNHADLQVHRFPEEDNYLRKAQHFLHCLRGEAEPTCPPVAALRALELVKAVEDAACLRHDSD